MLQIKLDTRSSKNVRTESGNFNVLDENLIHQSVHASQESVRFFLVIVHQNFLYDLTFSWSLLKRRVNHSEKLVES